MPKLLFTDEQKANLAKEAGITGVPDTNNFNKEYDPSTGEQKLYMKLGTSGKFFGSKPTTAKLTGQDALNAQVDYVKQKYGGQTMQDIYGAMVATSPSDKGAIRDKIAAGPGGIGSQLEGITQQIQNLQKLKAGNQAEIFSAVDPKTGQPVDPRIAVAAFQNRQKSFTDQENNLRALEDMYNAQLGALTDSEYSRQAAENDKNKTALSYLKDIEDRKTAADKIATDKSQFDVKLAEEKRQFNVTAGIGTDTMEGLKTVSFTDKAYLYPNEASLKNNNPAGIKNSINDRTRQLLIDAGVKWEGGTKPPPGESGSYMKFASVADGIKAHKVLLTSAGTDDVTARLKQWVGTAEGPAYAKQLMTAAGIPEGAKFSQLSEEQINKLSEVQMQKESPGFYKELQKTTTTTGTKKMPKTFNEYVEKVQIPDTRADGTPLLQSNEDVKAFIAAALTDYPTEDMAKAAKALQNRAPEGVKQAFQKYIDEVVQKEADQTVVAGLISKVPELTEASTKTLIRGMENSGKDPKAIISTLNDSGFFEEFGPWSIGSWGNDDQWEVVRDFAIENDLDIDEVLAEIKKNKKTVAGSGTTA